jgi:hypothetical protein
MPDAIEQIDLELLGVHREDARHILNLLLKDDFPGIWVANWENRDLRQLLWHRRRMVQARIQIMNQLQAVALNEGLFCGSLALDTLPSLTRRLGEAEPRTAQRSQGAVHIRLRSSEPGRSLHNALTLLWSKDSRAVLSTH